MCGVPPPWRADTLPIGSGPPTECPSFEGLIVLEDDTQTIPGDDAALHVPAYAHP
jgi:hypothetical protein